MLEVIVRRLWQSVIVLLAVSVLVFVMVYVSGDPVELLAPPDATEVEVAQLRKALGLDKPLHVQYIQFLKHALQGNLGYSYVNNAPAVELIFERMPATFELAMFATLIAVILGIPFGIIAAVNPEKLHSRLIMIGSLFGISFPTFWVGVMLILIFAVTLGWLPSSGRGETVRVFGIPWSFLTVDGIKHLILPGVTLAFYHLALLVRLVRAGMMEVLLQDYIKFAKIKGVSRRKIIFVHALKNIMIPVITIIGLNFGGILAFAVVTETVFAWPGMGKLVIDSIHLLDRPVVVAYLMIVAIIFVIINLIVDLTYTLLDPRVRLK